MGFWGPGLAFDTCCWLCWRSHRESSAPCDTRAATDLYAHPYRSAYCHAHADANPHSDGDAHVHAYPNTDAFTHIYAYSNAYGNTDSFANLHVHTDTYGDADPSAGVSSGPASTLATSRGPSAHVTPWNCPGNERYCARV